MEIVLNGYCAYFQHFVSWMFDTKVYTKQMVLSPNMASAPNLLKAQFILLNAILFYVYKSNRDVIK